MSKKWKRALFGGIGAIMIALVVTLGITGAFPDGMQAEKEEQKNVTKDEQEIGETKGHGKDQDQGQEQSQGQGKNQGQGQSPGQGQGRGQSHGKDQEQGQEQSQGQGQNQGQGQSQSQGQEQGQGPGQGQSQGQGENQSPDKGDGSGKESDEQIQASAEDWDSYLEQQVQEGIQSIAQSGAEVPSETQMRWATEDLYNPIDIGPLPEVEPQWVYCNSRAVNGVQQEEKAYIDQIASEMVQGLRTPEEAESVIAAYLEAQGLPERLSYFYGVRAYGKDQFLLRNLERASVRGQEWMDTDFNYIYYALYTEGEYDEFGQLYFYDWQVSF